MEDQILKLETQYWQGMTNHEYDIVKKLTYFPCTVVSNNGVKSVDESTFKSLFDQGSDIKMQIKGLTDAVVKVFSQSFATIGYVVEIEMDINGKSTLNKCACTSAWIQENGFWRCQLHAETDLK